MEWVKIPPIGFSTSLVEFGSQDYQKHIFDDWSLGLPISKFLL